MAPVTDKGTWLTAKVSVRIHGPMGVGLLVSLLSRRQVVIWQQVHRVMHPRRQVYGMEASMYMAASTWQQVYHVAASTWRQAYGSKITGPQSADTGSKPGQEALQATASSNRFMAARVKLLDHNLITGWQFNGLAGWVKGLTVLREWPY